MIMSKYDKLIGKWMDRHYCKDVKEDGKYIYCDKKTFINIDADDEFEGPFEDEYWEIVYIKRLKILEINGKITDQINDRLKPSDMPPQDFYNIIINAINKWFSEKFSTPVIHTNEWD
jgi:hypothetical protein